VLDAIAASREVSEPRPRAAAVPPAGQAYRLPVYVPTEADTVEPFTRRRAQVADHMTTSLATAAHVAAVTEIDMRRVLEAKRADAAHPSAERVKLSLTAYLVHALAGALAEHPRLNASVRDRELVLRGERNIGVAVDTEQGLVVPVIHRADELGLVGVARRLNELVAAARGGTLRPEMVQGGSFTLSNPGADGNLFGISVIRQPEVAILRAGAVVKRPVVRELEGEDAIVVRPMMYAALSYDHRVIDGRTGNAFLRAVVDRLEQMPPLLGAR
jgi:2-oxoglutarate dehydrogenase E2 component (dihydrolipoamide succinyltransferase)